MRNYAGMNGYTALYAAALNAYIARGFNITDAITYAKAVADLAWVSLHEHPAASNTA
jgi:hypothetical protein